MRPTLRVRAVFTAATLLATTATGAVNGVAAGMLMQSGTDDAAALGAPATAPGEASQLDGALRQLKQFLHLINIAKPEAAAELGQAMLDGGLTPAQLATVVDDDREFAIRFDTVMTRGRGMAGVNELASRFEQMLRDGRLELAREPKRIEESVALLTGTLRQQGFAKERLAAAGEYAMPMLLKTITSGNDVALEVAAIQVIESMRRYAVLPLSAALFKLDPINQRKVADILGEIGYPAAAPFLLELAQDPDATSDVKEAAARAYRRIGATSTSVTAQFAELSRRFFEGDESLVSYPTESVNNVWSFEPFGGLAPTPVPTEIFSEVMAMQMAKKSLAHDGTNGTALALYVAGDLRRENRLPDGATDPIFGGSQYTPSFFAMAAGPSVLSTVLGLAIDRKDTELVRDVIGALAETAGATNLVSGRSGRKPLLESLRYPEKRVQYEAALAIGDALPDRTFPGDFSIVSILASAVRDANTVVGGVVAVSEEDRRQFSGKLAGLGFTTLTGASDFARFEPEIAGSIGLDLLLVAGSIPSVKSLRPATRTPRRRHRFSSLLRRSTHRSPRWPSNATPALWCGRRTVVKRVSRTRWTSSSPGSRAAA